MHSVSELYLQLLENPEHTKEIKLTIAGTDYGHSVIEESPRVYGGLYSKVGI